MNLIDLGIPKFRRKYKDRPAPPVVVPCDLCFEGEKAAEFVNDVLAKNPHFADGIENFRQAKKIVGLAKPDPALGKSFGAMHGRWWYAE